ncbi:MAG: hypothetical protein M5T61_09800 [Acidimicrobiia bacterium]|nr:hypothetical protein [Acidimicrobiia bacterium]
MSDFQRISEEDKEKLGLTFRATGKLTGGNMFLDVLLGREGQMMYNPLVAMSIADQFRPQYEDEDATLIGKTFDALSPLGPSPGPWISCQHRQVGAYGPDAEPRICCETRVWFVPGQASTPNVCPRRRLRGSNPHDWQVGPHRYG